MAERLDVPAMLLSAAAGLGPDDHYRWPGHINKTTGYGSIGGRYAHREAWELVYGPIPPGMTIDHVGHTWEWRCCTNVRHMELVTRATNAMRGNSPIALNARKDRCKEGHLFIGDNLIVRVKSGRAPSRECRTCKQIQERARYARRHQRSS